ncbi:MAG: site-specific DNA-methyltransferase [Candidatus Bathyarchaeota archaeon]|uniref:DNA-methyltransferase n=1 Tax=Candidatus Bathycorpusculum sp. TaxID=2994959 RepID=UPI00282078FD|nr:site-specific DNA-methyltransferase [Candidatus Termiticorpusculum sp.]MCL2258014.1 site-specific DNA-methyltransferase [Candidatus Termiticorpusculum sp.]MCL2291776.1 site-specific DNA-methyltransferase [Candidatus Termiticorpusculum sp.]
MKTSHKIVLSSSSDMSKVSDASVDLMVTSPPYPMVEMWDEIFSKQNPEIGQALEKKDGNLTFELMNKELDKTWRETFRVLREGGFACINIGNATRKLGEEFKLYSSHSRILEYCSKLGFSSLPEILWRKQTNAPNKFMGSGMLPAGAYVTLEHEYILILRKGNKRLFKTDEEKLCRKKSAFFWEERNIWFSDIWDDLKGTRQTELDKKIRDRSGAYPFELSFRLINMLSLKEDTVLDPFLGTGTTTLSAMATGRNSIGFEIDSNLQEHFAVRFQDVVDFSNELIKKRLDKHLTFIQERVKKKGLLGYTSKVYGFPVMTNQETEIEFNELKKINFQKDLMEVEYNSSPATHAC